MIPETVGALLAFLGLIAPAQEQARRPPGTGPVGLARLLNKAQPPARSRTRTLSISSGDCDGDLLVAYGFPGVRR